MKLSQILKKRDALRADLAALDRVAQMFGADATTTALRQLPAKLRKAAQRRAASNGHAESYQDTAIALAQRRRGSGAKVTLPILRAIGDRELTSGELRAVVGAAASAITGMVQRGQVKKRGKPGAFRYRLTAKGQALLRDATTPQTPKKLKPITPSLLPVLQALREQPRTIPELSAAIGRPPIKLNGSLSRSVIEGTLRRDAHGVYSVTPHGERRIDAATV